MGTKLATLALAAAACGCAPRPAPYREAALAAARWIESVAVRTGAGTGWRADPARTSAPIPVDLYHGVAGVVLFLLETYRATGEARWLALARSGADYLVAHLPEKAAGIDAGLYTGIAGVGFALERACRVTDDDGYRFAVLGCLGLLEEGARRHDKGVDWNDTTDIIGGSAGIGLFLLDAAREFEAPRARALAEAAGRRLVAVALPAKAGRKWPMRPGYPRRMPNFSHGTAGVAYFLARLWAATRRREFLDAALDGARYLAATGGSEDGCLVFHHEPGGEALHYLGWCHGPPGTARLFYELWKLTGDEAWLRWTKRCAHSVLASGIPEKRLPGFWNNVGVCCGSAGVAAFLLDMHRLTGEAVYLARARKLTADLLARATEDARGVRWVQAEHRVRPDLLQAQTGYMQGAAGIGLWLLELDAFERGEPWELRLPDSPFRPRR